MKQLKKKMLPLMYLSISLCLSSCAWMNENRGHWQMRGVVLDTTDLATVDWPKLAAENGINTIGTHIFPEQVAAFISTDKGKAFLEGCKKYGIDVEHQLHAVRDLLPRTLFEAHPEWFRMNAEGKRVADSNCCVHSAEALDVIAKNAVRYAKLLPSTNHRYYFWLDDGTPTCECPECKKLTASEQALIIENRIIEELRKFDSKALLAHLAYHNTLEAPRKVKPAEGIFLEFAPFYRTWEKPLNDLSAKCTWQSDRPMTHADNLLRLEENLEVFPVETAVVLEYWLDVSMASKWKKPAVKLPWHREVFESDIETYANMGIRNVTSFAVYMDSAYFKAYPDLAPLKEYGGGLASYGLNKKENQ